MKRPSASAIGIAAAAFLCIAPPLQAQDSAAGEYTVPDTFEMYIGLLLRDDQTFEFALSVGAMDKTSSGTWVQDGETVTLTTSPKPVPPAFERAARNEASDAPFVLVTWPNGRGIPGVDIELGCEGDILLDDYTQVYGWSPPEGSCTEPQWIELTEGIHDIRSPRYDISGEHGALHFVLQPNSFGVIDLTGTNGTYSAKGLELTLMGEALTFVRVGND